MDHVPDKFEHPVRHYGYYSNLQRGTRKLTEQKIGSGCSRE